MDTPTGLGDKAAAVWEGVTGRYELRADELRLLEDACREIDLVERLEAEIGRGDLTVEGSQGQPVANPLIQEVRQHRTVVARLLGALKLPDDEGADGEGSGVSAPARALASARWARGA